MDAFSTQYMPSNAGLVRALPTIQKLAGTGGWPVWAAFFSTGVLAFFIAGLADVLIPRVWPGYPHNFTVVIGCVVFGIIAISILLPWLHRRTVRRFDQLLPPTLTLLSADDAGITIRDELSHGHWDWRHIKGASATPDGVVLLMGYGGAFIPSSAFRDVREQSAFIDLVGRRADR
jgi:hypothetical protein